MKLQNALHLNIVGSLSAYTKKNAYVQHFLLYSFVSSVRKILLFEFKVVASHNKGISKYHSLSVDF